MRRLSDMTQEELLIERDRIKAFREAAEGLDAVIKFPVYMPGEDKSVEKPTTLNYNEEHFGNFFLGVIMLLPEIFDWLDAEFTALLLGEEEAQVEQSPV